MTLIQPDELAEKETPVAPYDPLAPHYEAFVGGDRYGEWLGGLLDSVAEHGVTAGRALDVGCGTGRSLAALLDAGFAAEGCDPSPGMLRQARTALGPDVSLTVSALPDVPAGPPLDLVTALNDVLNYVAPEHLDAAVMALGARLRPGAVLLFDANTTRTFASFFGSAFCRETDERFFVWEPARQSGDSPDTHRADLHVFVVDPDVPGRWTRSVSRHAQHHHPHARVVDALIAAGLELLDVQGQHEAGRRDATPDEALHIKRIYLARLP
jgi:SAM-dependent methyltransferase